MTTHAHGPIVESHAGTGSHSTHDGHGVHSHEAHTVNIAKYIYVFIALCFLTGCSFFTYSRYWPWHDQPQVGWAFMMAVSCTKAMLVILFFMHVLYEANWKFVLTIPAAMMSIFLILMLVPDIGMRLRTASEERLYHMAEQRAAAHEQPHEKAADEQPVQQPSPEH
ncbi:MAG: cytochrome C oxidase subunit IV family protein [Pirellulales bacterium]|nr:cytochrome C oxidase subunit IV family protein [Pirellulales bacterium]